jgi:hypothetical protein
MATRRRRWTAIGGATAAITIGVWAAVALAAPSLTAPALSKLPVSLSWSDGGGAVSYGLTRTPGTCAAPTGAAVPLTLPSPTQAAFSDGGAPDGSNCYELTSTYGDSSTASATADVQVDNTPPMVTIAAPAATFVGGVVPINVSQSEPGSLTIATSPATTITPTSWDTNAVNDGTYTITAHVTDAAGNVGTGQRTVTVDNSPPTPFNASALPSFPGSPQIFWEPSSDPSGVTFRVVRNDGTANTVITGPNNSSLSSGWTDTPSPPIGTYTYTVQAVDGLGHVRSAPPLTVRVTSPGVTTVQNVTAPSPTNTTPHIAWERPISFLVTGYQVWRDGVLAKELDASALSFDDTSVPGQGLHSYTIMAESGSTLGGASAPVAVVYDTAPPSLDQPTATANPDGSISLAWPPATDPVPGSGLSGYVVRRGAQAVPPTTPTGGTAVCAAGTTATGCVDTSTQNGSIYGYAVFASDGAGNVTRQTVTARAVDSVPPDPVTNFHASVGPTNAHLTWDAPAQHVSDVAGYRIIKLINGAKLPTNPRDGTEVCPGLGFRASDCFVQNLSTGKKVTFAIYTLDEVPNFSAPVTLTVTPNATDHTKPALPTKVRISRVGARITMRWVSPKNLDLSHFVVNLNKKGPAKNPGVRPIVFKGRKLTATFTLHAGQIAYVNLFAVDLSGNFSRVTRRIVMPKVLSVGKHKKGAKTAAPKTTTPPKKVPPKKKAPGSTAAKPPPVQVVIN